MSTLFLPDDKKTPEDKNLKLSQYLTGPWHNLDIDKINRIEESADTDQGWEAILK